MKYVSRSIIVNDKLGIQLEAGDEVPAALIKESPWLVDELVVVPVGHELSKTPLQPQPQDEASQAVPEGVSEDSPVAFPMAEDNAPSSGSEEA